MPILEALAQLARPALRMPYILDTRRNHGLEHATIHLLNRQRYRLSGRSDHNGFIIVGEILTDKVRAAAEEALQRMKNGERELAIHPNCGTNLLATAFLTTLVAFIGFGGGRRAGLWDRFMSVMILSALAILSGPALGTALQRHFTTEGDLGAMVIVGVTRHVVHTPFSRRPLIIHRVHTRQG